MNLPHGLSDREKEVAEYLLQGKSNKEIAHALGIATRTAEFHISNIYEKLGVTSRAEAIIKLSEANLREPAGDDLRESTVEKMADPAENNENITVSIERITMRRLLIALTALIGVACFGLIILAGLAFFRGTLGPLTFSPATTVTIISPTHTPWITPTPKITRTPWVTPTPVTPSDTPNPPTAEPIQPAGDSFSYEGISFTLDPSVASGASGQVVPENPGSANGPFWDVNPQYVKISLIDYPLTGTFWGPAVSIYPVDDYRRLSPQADQTLDELKTFLDQKPAQADQIPFLPVVNAGQVFRSNVQYLDFQNGNGVRFLTLYAQYPAPVNNHDLFYTFQGLTADGNYVISIILPANHPSLLASADELSSDEFDAIVKDYDNYRAEIAATLSAQPASSFTPDLAKLDALVTSLAIDPDSFPH